MKKISGSLQYWFSWLFLNRATAKEFQNSDASCCWSSLSGGLLFSVTVHHSIQDIHSCRRNACSWVTNERKTSHWQFVVSVLGPGQKEGSFEGRWRGEVKRGSYTSVMIMKGGGKGVGWGWRGRGQVLKPETLKTELCAGWSKTNSTEKGPYQGLTL